MLKVMPEQIVYNGKKVAELYWDLTSNPKIPLIVFDGSGLEKIAIAKDKERLAINNVGVSLEEFRERYMKKGKIFHSIQDFLSEYFKKS